MPTLGASAETLWEREERTRLFSRLTVAALLILDLLPLLLLSVVVAHLLIQLLLALWAGRTGDFPAYPVRALVAIAALLFFGYIALYLVVVYRHRSAIPVRVMHYVGAQRVPVGELTHVKGALAEMVLASGLPTHPSLWIIEAPGVNALAASMGVSHTHMALTRGMVDHLSTAEIRAVLAHLIARVASGDTERETILAAASEVRVGNRLIDTWPFGAKERPSSLYPRGYSKSSLRRGDVGAMFLLKDPEALIASLEAIERHDNLMGDWTEQIGYLFVSWPYLDHDVDSHGQDFDQRRIQELCTLYGVWPSEKRRTERAAVDRSTEMLPSGTGPGGSGE